MPTEERLEEWLENVEAARHEGAPGLAVRPPLVERANGPFAQLVVGAARQRAPGRNLARAGPDRPDPFKARAACFLLGASSCAVLTAHGMQGSVTRRERLSRQCGSHASHLHVFQESRALLVTTHQLPPERQDSPLRKRATPFQTRYSPRITTIGSTPAARLAGNHAPTIPTITRMDDATNTAHGSTGPTSANTP